MDPRDVRGVQDARSIVEERRLKHVKIGVFDIDSDQPDAFGQGDAEGLSRILADVFGRPEA